jgi:hypothetical protein
MKGRLVCFILLDQQLEGLDHKLILRLYRKSAASLDPTVEFFTQRAHILSSWFLRAANRRPG